MHEFLFPGLGLVDTSQGAVFIEKSSDGLHVCGKNGVRRIAVTGDRRVEFIAFDKHTLAFVTSKMGYPAYYPVYETNREAPVKAVLMDLDGTSVKSEEFWIYIINRTICNLLDNPGFELADEDIPFVSGHSVSEHLKYCIHKYCPEKTLEEARKFYEEHMREEMDLINRGQGKRTAFKPSPGLKEFLMELKSRNIKIGLVTSGLHEKAWPEIVSAFEQLDMGNPEDFYDALITAGTSIKKGSCGTLGELIAKPHPWLYAEAALAGMGIERENGKIIGIEDSGAGVCAVRLAGYTTIGVAGGNIMQSGTRFLCDSFCRNFEEIIKIIDRSE